MKRVPTLVTVLLVSFFASFTGQPTVSRAWPLNSGLSASCSCNDVGALTDRLRGVEAVLRELGTQAQGPAQRGTFDANTFDQGLGEAVLRAQATGGIGSMVFADIDRFSCEINTGANLANIPGAPAGLGGSACLIESVTAQLNVRRQACLAAQNPSNQGNDYWEDRQMSDVIRELNNAYTAEANFLKQQIARLATTCGGMSSTPVPKPPQNICNNCVQYLFEGERTLPAVGRIRMSANEIINFTVEPDNKISGTDSITTDLDMSGSPCTVSGYNGVAEINIAGEILGGYVNAIITPRGTSQRTSAHMTITCPPDGKAEVFPVQQNYVVRESLKIPVKGQRYTEKRIDVSARTMGAMRGYIILRLFMTQ
jgi:hypothetical protein